MLKRDYLSNSVAILCISSVLWLTFENITYIDLSKNIANLKMLNRIYHTNPTKIKLSTSSIHINSYPCFFLPSLVSNILYIILFSISSVSIPQTLGYMHSKICLDVPQHKILNFFKHHEFFLQFFVTQLYTYKACFLWMACMCGGMYISPLRIKTWSMRQERCCYAQIHGVPTKANKKTKSCM